MYLLAKNTETVCCELPEWTEAVLLISPFLDYVFIFHTLK